MVSKSKIKRLEEKLPFKENEIYLFNEIEGQLIDLEGKEVNQDQLEQLKGIIIIDDVN